MAENGRRRCVFCDGKDLTLEHAWPDWICKLVTTAELEVVGPRVKRWPATKIGIKVRQVCEGCNNGWMADMEKETKPILMPMLVGPQSHIQLTVPDQEKLAIWAYKTALMVGLIGPVRNIPPSTYRVFFDSGRALPAD